MTLSLRSITPSDVFHAGLRGPYYPAADLFGDLLTRTCIACGASIDTRAAWITGHLIDRAGSSITARHCSEGCLAEANKLSGFDGRQGCFGLWIRQRHGLVWQRIVGGPEMVVLC